MSHFGFGGRPPFLPFARAASALASEVTRPPLRPSATAAGFLRDTLTAAGLRSVGIREHDLAVLKARGRASTVRVTDGLRGLLETIGGGHGLGGRHRRIKPNRLGSVNPLEIGRNWRWLRR
jgi:hypothetical protein